MSDKKFGLIICSCVAFKRPQLNFVHYVLTDIFTKKPVKMISEEYDDYNPDDIVDAMLNVIISDGNIPGILSFAGYYYESDGNIMMEMLPMPPAVLPIEGSVFSCYVDNNDGDRVYRDASTDKIITFRDVNAVPELKTGIDLFLSDDEYNSYNVLSDSRIIVMATGVDFESDVIYIDAKSVYRFGDYEDAYSDILCDLKLHLEDEMKKVCENGTNE